MSLRKRIQRSLLAGAIPLAVAACVSTSAPTPSATLSPAVQSLIQTGDPGIRVHTTIDEARGEVVFLAGPFHIPAMEGGHDGHAGAMGHGPHAGDAHAHHGAAPSTQPLAGHDHEVRTPLLPLGWPVDGWLRGFQIALFDAQGNPLPRDLMHHLITLNFDRRQLVYPVAERIIGIGQESENVILPERFGVPLSAGQQLGVYASWHNDTGEDLHGVHLEMRLTYRAANGRKRPNEVIPIYMDVNQVYGATTAFDIEPGRTSRAYEFTVPVGGRLLAVGGHLHDYGVEVRLEDAETGKHLVAVRGIQDDEGRVLGVETRILRRFFNLRDASIRLEPGHRYRVVALYESPFEEAIPMGGMAHMVGLFQPDTLNGWEVLDRETEIFALDVSGLPEPLVPARGHEPETGTNH